MHIDGKEVCWIALSGLIREFISFGKHGTYKIRRKVEARVIILMIYCTPDIRANIITLEWVGS